METLILTALFALVASVSVMAVEFGTVLLMEAIQVDMRMLAAKRQR